MPLSDHEQRLLEQMERVLAAEDPKLASTLRGSARRTRRRRRAVIAGFGFVVGIVVLFASVVVPQISGSLITQVLVGGAGFLLMLVGAYYVAVSLRSGPASPEADTPEVPRIGPGGRRGRTFRRPGNTGNKGGSFMSRMEDRWRRRREGGY